MEGRREKEREQVGEGKRRRAPRGVGSSGESQEAPSPVSALCSHTVRTQLVHPSETARKGLAHRLPTRPQLCCLLAPHSLLPKLRRPFSAESVSLAGQPPAGLYSFPESRCFPHTDWPGQAPGAVQVPVAAWGRTASRVAATPQAGGHNSHLSLSPVGRWGSERDGHVPQGCRDQPAWRDHPSRGLRERLSLSPHPSKGKDGERRRRRRRRRRPQASAPRTAVVGPTEPGVQGWPSAALGRLYQLDQG